MFVYIYVHRCICMGMGIVVETLWGMQLRGSVELHVERVCISVCEEELGVVEHSCSGKYLLTKD